MSIHSTLLIELIEVTTGSREVPRVDESFMVFARANIVRGQGGAGKGRRREVKEKVDSRTRSEGARVSASEGIRKRG